MTDHLLFHLVFLCQVLLVSGYLPSRILRRLRFVRETYPPASYPKLYPPSIEHYERKERTFRILNWIVLAGGVVLLAVLLMTPRSGEWDATILVAYWFVQLLPVVVLDLSSLRDARIMRTRSSVRRASLQPRGLLDFVSPAVLALAAAVYIAFSLMVVYVRQFEYSWFGGYGNIVGVTVLYLIMAAIALQQVHGRKLNPHQALEDRLKAIETAVHSAVLASIAGTIFIALNIGLAVLDQRALQPAAQSLFFQSLAAISYRVYLVRQSNFDVYREGSVVA